MKIKKLFCIFAVCTLVFSTAWADPGLSKIKAVLPDFQKLAAQAMKTSHTPGMAIVIVYKGKVIYLKGFGVRKAGTQDPITADTVFLLASVSKPFTSTGIAALVGKNKIQWDTTVADLDPAFRLSDPWVSTHLTLHDLLSHQSGLPDHAGDILEDLGYSRQEILHQLRYIEPLHPFRHYYAYTNFGYSEAAFAAAKSQNLTWQELMSQQLFEPLGMKQTSTLYQDYLNAKNKAVIHVIQHGTAKALYERDADAQAPAGGVSSTASDIAKWMILQLSNGKFHGKQIVAAQALEATHTPQIVTGISKHTGKPVFYGYGWIVSENNQGEITLSHSGGFSLGTRTEVYLVPKEKLGIAVLANAAITGLPEAVRMIFLDLLEHGKVTQNWLAIFNQALNVAMGYQPELLQPPKQPSPPLLLNYYTGEYTNSYFGLIKIFMKQGKLNLSIGPKQKTFILHHWDRDVFYLVTRGEMATEKTAVTFTLGPDGKAEQVTVKAWNKFGEGVFHRYESRQVPGQ